jgi:hypothetical protein
MAQPDPILTAWVCQTTGLSPTHPAGRLTLRTEAPDAP